MSENGEIYTAGKNFTLPPALTGWTNSISEDFPVNDKLVLGSIGRKSRHSYLVGAGTSI